MAFLLMEEVGKPSDPETETPAEHTEDKQRVQMIPVTEIRRNPAQPRRNFEEEALLSLAASIRRHGILQPLVVRKLPLGGYELIAGERRLRAAVLCGIREVPCLLRQSGEDESAELAIIENLQRRDLDMFEEASAIAALCARYEMTQEEIGRRLSVSQSYIANKLRLLRLSEEAQALIIQGHLTERHARAVLRLPEEKRLPALRHMAEEQMNVSAAERYVERLLEEKKPKPRHTGVIKDIRIFYNSLDRAVRLVKESGIGIRSERRENDDSIEVIIHINKKQEA